MEDRNWNYREDRSWEYEKKKVGNMWKIGFETWVKRKLETCKREDLKYVKKGNWGFGNEGDC